MYCPKCGQQNDDNARFCVKCGSQLPISHVAIPSVAAAVAVTGAYAGFWKRFAAFILDYLIVMVLGLVAGGIVGFIYGMSVTPPDKKIAEALGAIAGLLVWWLYFAIMESSRKQATLGKMALGIRVVNLEGGHISFARATGRNFAKILSGLILMIGYLMAGFSARKQALHDMVAGCLVVVRDATGADIQRGASAAPMPVWAIVLIVLAACIVPIGIIAAVALPAYQDYTVRARVAGAVIIGQQATRAVEDFYLRNNVLPRDLKEAGMSDPVSREAQSVSVDPRNGVVQVFLAISPLEGKSILFVPKKDNGSIIWTCSSDDVNARYLPVSCRK